MIHEVSGDILLTGAKGIAHGVAPNDHFEQGLALALREKWPAMQKDFRHYAHQTHPKSGEIWSWGGYEMRIINLLTQEGSFDKSARPGNATLGHVNHCLKRLRHFLETEKLESIALPRLATGVGGLNWNEVKPLIEQHLGDLATKVYLYSEYHAGEKGEER